MIIPARIFYLLGIDTAGFVNMTWCKTGMQNSLFKETNISLQL